MNSYGVTIVNRVIDFIVKRYLLIGICVLILTAPFAYFYLQQEFFTHISIYFDKDDPDIQYYEEFQEKYGNDEVAAIVFKDKDIFTPENIAVIRAISDMAKAQDNVDHVMSLTEVDVAQGEDELVAFNRLIPEDMDLSPANLSNIREKSLANPLIKGNLISKDGSTAAIMIEVAPISSNAVKHAMLRDIREKAEAITGDRITLHYSGGPYLEEELERLTHEDNAKFTPITLIVIIAVVYLMLRVMSLTLVSLINLMIIVAWAVGFLIMSGENINTVTVIIAPILLAIAIADGIHILSYYKKCYFKNGGHHKEAVLESLKSLWIPCLFTSLTTAVGYLSFMTTTVRPVRIVGYYTSIGVMIAFVMTIAFLPTMVMFCKPFVKFELKRRPMELVDQPKGPMMAAMTFLGNLVTGNRVILTVLFTIFTIVVGFGATKLRFETDFVRYLRDGNKIKNDIYFIEKNIRGTVPVELVLHARSPETDFTQPETLKLLEKIQGMIMNEMKGQFTTSVSVIDYIKEINLAFNNDDPASHRLPDSRQDIVDFYELGDNDILSRMIAPDKMEARLSFASVFGSTEESKVFKRYMEQTIKPLIRDRLTFTYTGLSSLYITMDHNLRVSQLRSFGTAFVLIFIMMYMVCRNFKLTAISMIPNLFPIFVILGIMGWIGIPLDGSTIMIASITIGIAVDDTIHFITWFKRNLLDGMTLEDAIKKTFKDTGSAIVMTSVVLCSCYLVLLVGSIVPVTNFGSLASLAMFFALIGDLFLLPALLLIFKPAIVGAIEYSQSGQVVADTTD